MLFLIAMACGQDHALGDAKFHFPWGQVGHHDGEFPNEIFGLVVCGNATEDLSGLFFTHVQLQTKQLGGAGHAFAMRDERDPEVHFAEVLDANDAFNGRATRIPRPLMCGCRRCWNTCTCRLGGFKKFVHHQGIHALHEMLVNTNFMALSQNRLSARKIHGCDLKETLHLTHKRRQDGFEVEA